MCILYVVIVYISLDLVDFYWWEFAGSAEDCTVRASQLYIASEIEMQLLLASKTSDQTPSTKVSSSSGLKYSYMLANLRGGGSSWSYVRRTRGMVPCLDRGMYVLADGRSFQLTPTLIFFPYQVSNTNPSALTVWPLPAEDCISGPF